MGRARKVKRKACCVILAGALVFLGILDILIVRSLYIKKENLLMAYEKELVPGIVCWGDSLTIGAGGGGVSYPLVLEERLHKDRLYIPVANMGIGGENTVAIAGRAGAIPFKLKEFTIPAQTVEVEISFLEEEGKSVRLIGNTGVNPCVINGVEGRIEVKEEEEGRMAYSFIRSDAGEEIHVQEGTEVVTWAASQFSDYIFVVFMGENLGWDSIPDLIGQQQAILSMQEKQEGKYIVVGLPTGTREERAELENALYETYGDRFLNIREYLSTQGIYDAKLTPSQEDLDRMESGMIPTSLLTDHIHFNAEGYRLIGNLMYERMEELGYFEELKKAVEEYGAVF